MTNSDGSRPPGPQKYPSPTLNDYLRVATVLTLFTAAVSFSVVRSAQGLRAVDDLVGPILAMVGLTGVVWLLMVVARNGGVLRGLVSAKYYEDYTSDVPIEWIERPARTFNNLMQVPTLFYVVCLLMIATGWRDDAQLGLAWLFVLTRLVHATVYIAFNNVKWRFACWMTGCITLIFLWVRFAASFLS